MPSGEFIQFADTPLGPIIVKADEYIVENQRQPHARVIAQGIMIAVADEDGYAAIPRRQRMFQMELSVSVCPAVATKTPRRGWCRRDVLAYASASRSAAK